MKTNIKEVYIKHVNGVIVLNVRYNSERWQQYCFESDRKKVAGNMKAIPKTVIDFMGRFPDKVMI